MMIKTNQRDKSIAKWHLRAEKQISTFDIRVRILGMSVCVRFGFQSHFHFDFGFAFAHNDFDFAERMNARDEI